MELREWLIILGLVLVTIIVVDGVRRLQRQRKVPRLDQVDRGVGDDEGAMADPEEAARQEEINWELPNGGARVVRSATQPTVVPKPKLQRQDHPGPSKVFSRMAKEQEDRTTAARASAGSAKPTASASRDAYHGRDEATTASPDAPAHARHAAPSESRKTQPRETSKDTRHATPADEPTEAPTGRFNRAGMAAALRSSSQRAMSKMSSAFHRHDDEEHPPHREPSLGESTQDSQGKPGEMEPAITARDAADEPSVRHDRPEAPAFEPPFEPVGYRDHAAAYADDEVDESAYGEDEAVSETPPNDVVTPHPVVEKARRHNVSAQRARETLAGADEVIVISVLARNEEGFSGTALLNLMLACGLRYSEMGIFLRYETEDAESELQFAMVDVVKPGTFDLEAMDDFSTPGVTFLMPLPGAQDSAAAFEAMVETAMVLVRNLGGELKDENRSVMTAQTVEFARQRVQEFERRNRLHRYQAN